MTPEERLKLTHLYAEQLNRARQLLLVGAGDTPEYNQLNRDMGKWRSRPDYSQVASGLHLDAHGHWQVRDR